MSLGANYCRSGSTGVYLLIVHLFKRCFSGYICIIYVANTLQFILNNYLKFNILCLTRFILQELKLAEAVVNRLQTVGFRFCGAAEQALPRLRGALPAGTVWMLTVNLASVRGILITVRPFLTDKFTRKALDELLDLFSYLRVWKIEEKIYINALMPPSEGYHRDVFFQVCFELCLYMNFDGELFISSVQSKGKHRNRFIYLEYFLHNKLPDEEISPKPNAQP